VRERMKTCLFRRFRASSSDVFVERIERGFRERMSNVGSGREEVVGGKRDVRNDPMDAITVSDYLSAFIRKWRGRLSLQAQYKELGISRKTRNPPNPLSTP
jgi:hypothetical protein